KKKHEQFINDRLKPKIVEFKINAKKNKQRFYLWQSVSMVCAALVPVVTSFEHEVKWLIAFLGGASALLAGFVSFFKFQENWIRSRNTHEDLETNLLKFNLRTGIYEDEQNAFKLLVDVCESILQADIGKWTQSMTSSEAKEGDG
ncbi:MAG: DUF4231 domain-containing protein, partial [Bacteroidota bacterium]